MKQVTPKASPNSFSIRQSPIVGGLRKWRVIGAVACVLGLIGGVLVWGFSDRSVASASLQEKAGRVQENDFIARLPKDYSDIKASLKPKIESKLVVKHETDSSKLKELARKSDLNFKLVGSRRELPQIKMPDFSKFQRQSSGSEEPDEKEKFLAKAADDEVLKRDIFVHQIPYVISAGTVISGVLLSSINSDLPGQILGQVSENVYDSKIGKYLLIPQGTKIIGRYDSRVNFGQSRVLIKWERLLMPDRRSIVIENMQGLDAKGVAGMKDKVNNHYDKLMIGVVMGSLFGIGTAALNDLDDDKSFANNAAQSVGQSVNDAASQITKRNLSIAPTIEIRAGMRFKVFVNRDVVLAVTK